MHRNLRGFSLSVLAALFGFGLVSSGLAQVATPTPVPPAAGTSAHAQIMAQLRAAHKLLVASDHDYQGHRAKAAEEVHKAIKMLAHHHNQNAAQPGAAAPGKVPAANKAARPHVPQATSDAQLKQAQQLLNGVLTELNSRHPKAAGNVKTAICEINTALGIK